MIAMVLVVGLATAFLVRARAQAQRRRAESWEELVARIEPGWSLLLLGECLSAHPATPEQRWESLRGARGLCVMFQNAKVMLQIADYAARNGSTIDLKVLAELRSDALQIRASVVLALTQYALHQINERMCANALNAASLYKNMSLRMSELMKVNGGPFAAQFVGAV